LSFRIVGSRGQEHADAPHPLALLCVHRERPGSRRAAEQRDEVAALQLIELHLPIGGGPISGGRVLGGAFTGKP
jgi:hypothetical protein